jgi:Leucine rich repeat
LKENIISGECECVIEIEITEMKMIMRLVMLALVANCIIVANGIASDEIEADDKMFKHLCNFDSDDTVVDDEDFCNCDVVSSPLIGRPTVTVDCMLSDRVTNLTNEIFAAEKLPINTVSLILSYQQFSKVPDFVGSLVALDLSNNQISIVKNFNFIHIKSLERLDLSYNLISEMEPNAFSLLTLLHHLDLTNNLLVVVPANVFAPLITLQTLILSSNEGFGRLMGKDVVNSSFTEVYLQLGVSPHLQNLEMKRCNLTKINLQHGVDLQYLNLGKIKGKLNFYFGKSIQYFVDLNFTFFF